MTKKEKKSRIYFTTVVALGDSAVIGGHMYAEKSDPTFTRLSLYKEGNWGLLDDIKAVVYSLEAKPSNKPELMNLCVLGRNGFFREYIPGEKPENSFINKRAVGYLEDLRYIGNNLYACGSQGQVYCKTAAGWISVDNNLFVPFSGKVERCLLSIDGSSEDNIIVVGEQGLVNNWNGERWCQLDLPTNLSINYVLYSSDGSVYVCGDGGFINKLSKPNQWLDLSDITITEKSLWSMTEFQGKIYIAAEDKLLWTDGKYLGEITIPLDIELFFMAVDSSHDTLWCVGDENVLMYDGEIWHSIQHPDNK